MFSNMSNELSKDFFILLLLIFPLLFLVQGIMDVAIWAVTRDGCNKAQAKCIYPCEGRGTTDESTDQQFFGRAALCSSFSGK